MDFIAYMTTIGGRIELEAADATEAVRTAIELAAAAGYLEELVVDLSYRHPDDRNFRAMGREALWEIPGTVHYKKPALPVHGQPQGHE